MSGASGFRGEWECLVTRTSLFTKGRVYGVFEMDGAMMVLNDYGIPWSVAEILLDGYAEFRKVEAAPAPRPGRLRRLLDAWA